MNLPDDFLPRTTQLLLPRLSTPDEREAWLAQAFFLNDPRLYHDLRQMSGVPIVFVTRCITALLTAKCIPGRDIHSLALLLNAVRIGSAPSEQREIDVLVDLLDPMCGPDSPEPHTGGSVTVTPPPRPNVPLQTIDTPVDERTPTVFISYAHADDEFAHRLIADLQDAGHAIWIDTVSIKGGDAWVRSIADGIRNSYAFLTLVTPEANLSRWVLREYLLAENLKKPIYPVLARQAEIPIQMIDRQVVMMHEDYADGLRELFETLPSPSIPVPAIEDVIIVQQDINHPSPAAPQSAPSPAPVQPPPAPIPPAPLPSRAADHKTSDASEIGLGGLLSDFADFLTGRRDKKTSPTKSQPDEVIDLPQLEEKSNDRSVSRPESPITRPGTVAYEDDLHKDEAEIVPPAPSRRAIELQYLQRQWAEAFSARQDAPATGADMTVRWGTLPFDPDHAPVDMKSGSAKTIGAELLKMRRMLVTGDAPHEISEAVWSALEALMNGALNDLSQPLPIVIDMAKWTDAAQSLEAFIQAELGELGVYWPSLVAQERAALILTGVEARHADVALFLRRYSGLPLMFARLA